MKYPVLITSVYDTPELLRWFLPFYTKIGVRKFYIAVRIRGQKNLLEEVIHYCKGFDVELFPKPYEVYDSKDKALCQREILQGANLHPRDFYLWVDIDEFHEYPMNLSEMIEACEESKLIGISGRFWDRVPADGKLIELTDLPLNEQASWGCNLTKNICKGQCRKVMLLRADFMVQGAGAHFVMGRRLKKWPAGTGVEDYRVHHFKWFASVMNRGRERLATGNITRAYRREWRNFFQHYDKHGRIRLELPELKARESSTLLSF